MNPVAETYARIMERRKGGKRLPIEGSQRDLVTASLRHTFAALTLDIGRDETFTAAASHTADADIGTKLFHPDITVASTQRPPKRPEREK